LIEESALLCRVTHRGVRDPEFLPAQGILYLIEIGRLIDGSGDQSLIGFVSFVRVQNGKDNER